MMKRHLSGDHLPGRPSRVLAFCLVLAGCSIQITRSHDAALITGLNAANEEALVFFSEVSTGVSRGGFGDLAPRYDSLIGKFEALRLQSKVRPIPALGLRLGSGLPGCGTAGECLDSSTSALEIIVDIFEVMKSDNRDLGLTPVAVQINKAGYEIAIEQVLVIENALADD